MKTKKLILTIALCLAAGFSCYAANSTAPAVVLQDDCSLWVKKSEGMMEYKSSVPAGTEISVYTNDKELVSEKATWTTSKDKTMLTFVKCIYNGNDFYIISGRFAANARKGVTLTSCAVYNTPSLADPRTKALNALTFIAVIKPVATITAGFLQIAYFDENLYSARTCYVRRDNVTTEKDDLTAARILKAAESSKDEATQAELLENIKELNVSDAMLSNLTSNIPDEYAQVYDLASEGTRDVNTPAPFYYTENDGSYLNIREKASTKSKIVGQLGYRMLFNAIEMTVNTETIDGKTAPWYYVSDVTSVDGSTVSGWVFGGYLEKDYSVLDDI